MKGDTLCLRDSKFHSLTMSLMLSEDMCEYWLLTSFKIGNSPISLSFSIKLIHASKLRSTSLSSSCNRSADFCRSESSLSTVIDMSNFRVRSIADTAEEPIVFAIWVATWYWLSMVLNSFWNCKSSSNMLDAKGVVLCFFAFFWLEREVWSTLSFHFVCARRLPIRTTGMDDSWSSLSESIANDLQNLVMRIE